MLINYTLPPNPSRKFKTETDVIVFGRSSKPDPTIDVDLSPDSTVSHHHARLTYENGTYWLEDLGSKNGTRVNGKPITGKVQLALGAHIQIGQTTVDILEETAPLVVKPESESAEQAEEENGEHGTDSMEIPGPEVKAALEQAQRQLQLFYTLGDIFANATALEPVLQTLIEQVQQVLPTAQRGAVLLPDEQGALLLKAHWPTGAHSVSMTLVKQAFSKREPFLWTAPVGRLTNEATKHRSVLMYRVQAAMYVPLVWGGRALGVMYVDNYEQRDAFTQTDLELLRAVASQLALFISDRDLREALQRQKILRSNLLRQFPPSIAERMEAESNRLRLGGERVNPVTILVSDVRGFTALSAKMEPDDVVRMLNEMFDAFVPIIFEYDGVVDKYAGDSILAVFGSPERDNQQWEKAVRAGLEMQRAMRKLGEGWKVRRLPVLQVGVGIHTGEVIHGFIGSTDRMEYTVIGDAVNRAARYCDGAEAGEVLISQAVYERVFRLVDVNLKTIQTKHPELEPDLKAYIVKGLKWQREAPTQSSI